MKFLFAWLAYAAMNHDRLFRIPTSVLQDTNVDESALQRSIEDLGPKPLNDGLSVDDEGRLFITDVEHQDIMARDPDGTLRTVIRDERIRWADGLSFGPDGWLYLADSAIPEIVLQSAAHHKAVAPFTIWRFKPGSTAALGQ
ncbi:MAG: L-dopachrome tautomerase-related protein [Burkholderiaceae bacterium]